LKVFAEIFNPAQKRNARLHFAYWDDVKRAAADAIFKR